MLREGTRSDCGERNFQRRHGLTWWKHGSGRLGWFRSSEHVWSGKLPYQLGERPVCTPFYRWGEVEGRAPALEGSLGFPPQRIPARADVSVAGKARTASVRWEPPGFFNSAPQALFHGINLRGAPLRMTIVGI